MKPLFLIKTALRRRPALNVILFFFFSANVIFGFKVIKEQVSEIRLLEERILNVRKISLEDATILEPGTEDPLMNIRTGVEIYRRRFSDYRELTIVLEDVFKVAKRNGFRIPVGNYSTEKLKRTDMSKYTFSFPLEGRYPQIRKFIYDVESLQYPLVIEALTLTSSKVAEGKIRLEVVMSTYYL
jgi:Tfp pilus assembly protein PilO